MENISTQNKKILNIKFTPGIKKIPIYMLDRSRETNAVVMRREPIGTKKKFGIKAKTGKLLKLYIKIGVISNCMVNIKVIFLYKYFMYLDLKFFNLGIYGYTNRIANTAT